MNHINDRCTDVETRAEAEYLARLDYELNLGHEVMVSCVTVYDENDYTEDLTGSFRVRLDRTKDADLRHRNYEYVDPIWDLIPLEPIEGDGVWTHGPSYRVLELAHDRLDPEVWS